MNITNDIKYIGVKDTNIKFFEGQYKIDNGVKYNSYLILDDKIALMDLVEITFKNEWLTKIKEIIKYKKIDYLIIHHMEPDHSSSLKEILKEYKDITIVSTLKSFELMKSFYNLDITNKIIIKHLDTLNLGKHTLTFYLAPMVHWPEVMVSYDNYDKALFSADAFGKFGVNDDNWLNDARHYYFSIIGKYGEQVKRLLNIINNLEVKYILSLHGEILKDNIDYYLNIYKLWSSYKYENEGIIIVYGSMYGNTKEAAFYLYNKLKELNIDVVIYDVHEIDLHYLISEAFKYKKLILASPTYNNDIFPFMKFFLLSLISRNYQNREIGLIENGGWSIVSNKMIKDLFSKSKNIKFYENEITIHSSLKEENLDKMNKLINEIHNN